MTKQFLVSQLKRFWRNRSGRHHIQGFTLLELLVVTVIGGLLISGLMYVVIELLGTDQRESSRTETQREMQMALDYISSELREAVYVYTGDCLVGEPDQEEGDACHGLLPYLPTSLSRDDTVPILAFWKQQPIPDALKDDCAASIGAATSLPCLSAHSYALVVYSLQQWQEGDTWKGRARITRYALTEFDQEGERNEGYANPGARNTFSTWPYENEDNKQTERPIGFPQVLVDFVDDGSGGFALGASIEDTNLCPTPPPSNPPNPPSYNITPPLQLYNTVFNGPRGFFACVNSEEVPNQDETDFMSATPTQENQDIILYIRGNANGRPGIRTDEGFLPALETRVLSRGVLERNPGGS
jgi:prepilin-type N-terminal cleavage/methylation domain-containing protein